MEKKLTIEELEKQCIEAEENFKTLRRQLSKMQKEEEEARQVKLKAEKESRYNDIIDAYNKFMQLKNDYLKDYGYFAFDTRNKNDDSHSWFWNSIGLF